MNILDKIVAHKKSEVAIAKASKPLSTLEKEPLFARTGHSLAAALRQDNPGILAEFKRKSPSRGCINDTAQPEIVTAGYVAAGARGLSVLTDGPFFGGSFDDFSRARSANPDTPLLRKDFMIDEYQLYEAKALGADVILLIAACLAPQQIRALAQKAHELDLEVLLEVHDLHELNTSLCDAIDIVGVNNRNLKTFTTSVETSLQLVEHIPSDFVKVSESGLHSAEMIAALAQAGYAGFLIGEAFMKERDPAAALKLLQTALKNVLNPTTHTV